MATPAVAGNGILPPSGTPTVVNTVPANGDVNPYGVAFVPKQFPSGGLLQPGDILVSNFNAQSNLQGTGTTIVKVRDSTVTLFFQGLPTLGLTTALAVLKSGFVIVGNFRVLATETASFGIRCLTVEPGGFATDWAGALMEIEGIPAEYDGTVGATARPLKSDVAKAGDPKRAGEILVRVVKRQHLPTHLLLGVGAVHLARDYSRRQIAEDEVWREVSISADFGQRYPVDLPNGV